MNAMNYPGNHHGSPPGDDWLDDLLGGQPAEIDDDGFSRHVVARLRRHLVVRAVVLGLFGGGGAALSYWLLPPRRFLALVAELFAAMDANAATLVALSLGLIGITAWFFKEVA